MVGKEVKRVSRGYHYFLVRPGRNGNAHLTAERLMRIRNVREVSITEGDYGFVVKAQHVDGKGMCAEITRAVGGRTAVALCHCKYVKQ